MAILKNKAMNHLFPLHLISQLFLALYALTLGLTLSLPVIIVCEVAIIAYARANTKLFFFLWQVPFFIVCLIGLLTVPDRLLNDNNVPLSAQLLFIFVLVIVEAVLAALCFLGERPIKAILFGSTAVMIATVLLIIALIGSEGMMGLVENDAAEMLSSTVWSPSYNPDVGSDLNITTEVVPYDYNLTTSNRLVHVQPGIETMLFLYLSNRGALSDHYSFSVFAETGVETHLSIDTVQVDCGNTSEIPLTVCSPTSGSFSIQVRVTSDQGMMTKGLDIDVEVSNIGIELDYEYQETYKSGSDTSTGSFPLKVTNVGTQGCNITFKVTASDSFRPSIYGTSNWDYALSEGYSHLDAGETGNFSLVPRFLTALTGVYYVRVDVYVNGTDVHDTYVLLFDYDLYRIARSLSNGSLPLYSGSETEWKIKLETDAYSIIFVKLTTVPSGYSVAAYVNGTEIPTLADWTEVDLDDNGTAIITLLVSTTSGKIGDVSELTISMNSAGTEPSFGMAAFLFGTALTVILALIMAVPLALGSAIFLAEYSSVRLRKILKPIIEILAGIPSVVYGLWGALTLGPLLSTSLYPIMGSTLGSVIPFFDGEGSYLARSIMTASIILAIMILPIIMALSYDALQAVPSEMKDASLATGASKWQTVRRVIMVKARSGIIASVMLGMGRAIGETMAVLMIMGCTSKIPENAFDSVGTMTAAIASSFNSTYAYDSSRHGLFAVALVLFVIVFVLNLVIIRVTSEREGNRLSKTFRHMVRSFRRPILSRKVKMLNATEVKRLFKPSIRSAFYDKCAKTWLYACVLVLIGVVFYIIANIIVRGGSSFDLSLIFEVERAAGAEGGFLNSITGSLELVAIAIGVSAPISVLSAIYVNEYANGDSIIVKAASLATNTLASTPSIVFGVFGLILFVLYLDFGFSLLAGGLTLAIMAIPLIFVSTLEGLKAAPPTLREASYALGVSKWATIRNIILPVSFSSISSGVIIAIGRTIGETAAVMLTAAYSTVITKSLFSTAGSIPNMIYQYYDSSSKIPNIGEKLYAASFILVMIIIALNLTARFIAVRSQKRMGIETGKKAW